MEKSLRATYKLPANLQDLCETVVNHDPCVCTEIKATRFSLVLRQVYPTLLKGSSGNMLTSASLKSTQQAILLDFIHQCQNVF